MIFNMKSLKYHLTLSEETLEAVAVLLPRHSVLFAGIGGSL